MMMQDHEVPSPEFAVLNFDGLSVVFSNWASEFDVNGCCLLHCAR
jgi:hypothetical protein